MRFSPHCIVFVAIALSIGALAAACTGTGGKASPATPEARAISGDAPVVVAVRAVCRLAADTPGARAAQVRGVDGTQSAVAGGRSYWFFGDTVRLGAGGRQDVIPATVATTEDTDGSDCLDLEFKAASGLAEPMFPRLAETTAWPDGVLALDDGSILFYMVKAYRQSPFAWHVGEVGLGRIPPGSLDGERLVETIWDEQSGFGSRVAGVRSPVRDGDLVYVYIHADDGANYVGRAALDRIAASDAYTYWDGAGWTAEPSRAAPLWHEDAGGFPADNGLQVTRDERTGRWLALYNAGLATVKVRTADNPWGPWSEPLTWFDCRPLVGDRYPYCYTGELHRQLDSDGGMTRYMTISSQEPYDVTLVELHMGVAVRAWRDADGARRLAVLPPGDGWNDTGVAFYASDRPVDGMSPVYERTTSAGYEYGLTAPAPGAAPAFYAYATAQQTGAVRTRPTLDPRGNVAFHVPCAPDLDGCNR